MKFLFDFFPILLFFITFKLTGGGDPETAIIYATEVMIIATFVQVSISWFRYRKIEKMHLITLGLVVVFGGATILLEDEIYIKWKPTVVNWLFALAFLVTHFINHKTLVERMMGSAITLPRLVWKQLNMAWILFFIVMGFINLYVIYNFDTDTWVNFKLFGLMGLTFVFVIAQAFFLAKYIEQPDKSAGKTD